MEVVSKKRGIRRGRDRGLINKLGVTHREADATVLFRINLGCSRRVEGEISIDIN